jgi:hypothetical protein
LPSRRQPARERHRDQVGEALPRPDRRVGEERPGTLEGAQDLLRHRHLFTTVLISLTKGSGEWPGRGEEFREIHGVSWGLKRCMPVRYV